MWRSVSLCRRVLRHHGRTRCFRQAFRPFSSDSGFNSAQYKVDEQLAEQLAEMVAGEDDDIKEMMSDVPDEEFEVLPEPMKLPIVVGGPAGVAAGGLWSLASRYGEECITQVEQELDMLNGAIDNVPEEKEHEALIKEYIDVSPELYEADPEDEEGVPESVADEIAKLKAGEFEEIEPLSLFGDFLSEADEASDETVDHIGSLFHPSDEDPAPGAETQAIHPMVFTLLTELSNDKKLSTLPDVIASFGEIMNAYRKQVKGVVTSSEPLTKKDVKRIEKFLKTQLEDGQTLQLVTEVDPKLVAGFTMSLSGILWDLSAQTVLSESKAGFDQWINTTPWSFSDGQLFSTEAREARISAEAE